MWYKLALNNNEMAKNDQLISAVVLLKKENDKYFVLLNEKTKGKWELPGGKVEPNETNKEAAIREIKEETNIEIDPDKLITIDKMVPEYKNNKLCNYFAYSVDPKEEVKVGSDARKLKWFDIEKLPEVLWGSSKYILDASTSLVYPDKDKFVFVDIDGVLNLNDEKHKQKYYDNVLNLKEIILEEKVKLLNKIYEELNPTFVLSSHWRKFGSIVMFNRLFKDLGFEGQFSLSTPFEGIEHDDRWKQIKKVLKKYEPKKYVILDDKHISLKKDFHNKNYIHIDDKTGLTEENIEQAIGILKGK